MKVKSIKEVKPRKVYAIKTTSNTFIADGLAHHNCIGCNMYKQGEQYLYAKNLDAKYGEGTADALMAKRHDTHKFTIPELEEIIQDATVQIQWYQSHQ